MGARRCGTPVGLIAGLLAFLALAAPAQARDCETWNYDLEQRCLSQGDGARQGETVRIENAGDKVQTFSYQQWYSVCGQASGHPPSALNKVVLQPREVLTIQLPPHPGAKPGDGAFYCTELFIFDCNAAGATFLSQLRERHLGASSHQNEAPFEATGRLL